MVLRPQILGRSGGQVWGPQSSLPWGHLESCLRITETWDLQIPGVGRCPHYLEGKGQTRPQENVSANEVHACGFPLALPKLALSSTGIWPTIFGQTTFWLIGWNLSSLLTDYFFLCFHLDSLGVRFYKMPWRFHPDIFISKIVIDTSHIQTLTAPLGWSLR